MRLHTQRADQNGAISISSHLCLSVNGSPSLILCASLCLSFCGSLSICSTCNLHMAPLLASVRCSHSISTCPYQSLSDPPCFPLCPSLSLFLTPSLSVSFLRFLSVSLYRSVPPPFPVCMGHLLAHSQYPSPSLSPNLSILPALSLSCSTFIYFRVSRPPCIS